MNGLYWTIRTYLRKLFAPLTELSDDEQYEAWKQLITRIYKETVYAFRNRFVWRELNDMYRNNQRLREEGGFFHDWMKGCYGRDQAVAIRREADRSSDVLNLVQLLYQMSKRPEVLTRERYQALFSPDSVITDDMQEKDFTRMCGPGPYMDPAVIKRDYKRLLKDCRPVVNYVNKKIAHRTDVEVNLTIEQIDKAMDAVEELLQKYYLLFTAATLVGAEPAIQFNWYSAFSFPWIAPRDPDG
jgi:hypothetical protein